MSTQTITDNEASRSIDKFLRTIGVGRRAVSDPFFDESHKVCKLFQRTGITVEDDEELCHDVMREFPCNVVGCAATFRNLIDFEIHYNGSHRYICHICNGMRASARLLEIHIQESHDSYFEVLAERRPMYQCYVTECATKFSNPSERRNHCTTVHKFPKNFRYDHEKKKKVTKNVEAQQDEEGPRSKPKNARIALNKNRKCKTFASKRDFDVPKLNESRTEISVDKSPVRKSILAFVPRQVANKLYTNALTNNKSTERNVLESETLMDLAGSLPE